MNANKDIMNYYKSSKARKSVAKNTLASSQRNQLAVKLICCMLFVAIPSCITGFMYNETSIFIFIKILCSIVLTAILLCAISIPFIGPAFSSNPYGGKDLTSLGVLCLCVSYMCQIVPYMFSF